MRISNCDMRLNNLLLLRILVPLFVPTIAVLVLYYDRSDKRLRRAVRLGGKDIKMGAKQAVTDVLNHRVPEYIPLGTYAIDCDTVERILGHETYVRNKVKTQLALWEGRRDEVAQSLMEDSVALFRKLPCIDVLLPYKEALLLPPKGTPRTNMRRLDDVTWESPNGTVYRMSELTNDVTVVAHPQRQYTPDDFTSRTFAPPDDSVFEAYDHLVKAMCGDRFIAGGNGGFNVMPLLGGMENGLMLYLLEPETVQAAIDQSVARENAMDEYRIRDGVDQLFVEVDTASTSGPLISPELFRKFCLPAMKERIQNLKRYRDKVMLHNCGNNWKLLDMIVEAGVDCYQSLQTDAGMDVGLLHERYGTSLSFWGGVPVEKLISGTADEVRAEVRRVMEGAKRGGYGFILGPSHSIAYGVRYDNFMAMLDEHDKLKWM